MVGFENEKQEQEVWNSLKQKYIPFKFSYVGKAALAFDEVMCTDSYNKATKSSNDEYLKIFLDNSNINSIADIGSGNGDNSARFIERLLQAELSISNYFCCDFSDSLSELCINKLENKYQFINFKQILWDIETEKNDFLLNHINNEKALIVFLGNTIGNVIDVDTVLKNIYTSARIGDKFILEVSIRNTSLNSAEVLEDYNNPFVFKMFAEVLHMTGINTDKGNYKLYYDDVREAIIGDFEFSEDITLLYKSEELTFHKGDIINSCISRRLDKSVIENYLKSADWLIDNIIENENGTVALFFCNKC